MCEHRAMDGDWVSVFRASSRRPCEEQALVLGAMGLEHLVSEQLDGCHVLVRAADAARALEQLQLYRAENPGRRGARWPDIAPSRGAVVAFGFAAVVFASWIVQARYLMGIDWLTAGELVAGRVRDGETWRVVTALMLHADIAHVTGNVVFGAFFGYLAGQYVGSGVAGAVIVWTAGLGNLMNAWVQPAGHRSIGSSTAVFAALGLVAAFVWGISRQFTLGWARRWSPVVGAVALLAYTGTGDAQTDVVAHLAGFVAGALGGACLWLLPRLAGTGRLLQAASGVLAVATLAAAWALALTGA
jgi:membrane associated rhomboid family serine protease